MERYFIKIKGAAVKGPTHLRLTTPWGNGGYYAQITPVIRGDDGKAVETGPPRHSLLIETTQRCHGAACDAMDIFLRHLSRKEGVGQRVLERVLEEDHLATEEGIWT